MTNKLTNKQASIFNDFLKSYNNAFFKDLTNKAILAELENIMDPNNLLNITDSNSSTYSTDQLNNFIRNIVNFDIKTFDNLKMGSRDTNMEFVSKTLSGTSPQEYNDKVKNFIIDKLNIINVFVDLLDAYKYCIDNENNSTVKSGYSENVDIQSIQIVADTTRMWTSSPAARFPTISDHPNVGYIKKVTDNKTTKITLFLSIQSFNAGFSTSIRGYKDLFDKKTGASDAIVSATVEETVGSAIFLNNSSGIHPSETDIAATHTLASTAHDRQIFMKTDADPVTTATSETDANKNIIKSFLHCLINIEPALRKQTVYALYYYYNFVQLYSTFIINVCNVMYANVVDTANLPLCIETINTTYNQKNSRSVSGVKIRTAGAQYIQGESIYFIDSTAATDKVAATFSKLDNIAVIPLDATKLDTIIITNRGSGYTRTYDIDADVKKLSSGSEVTGTAPSATASITTIIVPVAMENRRATQDENIDKLKNVYSNVINSINLLQKEIIKYGTNNHFVENNVEIVNSGSTYENNGLGLKKSPQNNVVIILTNSTIKTKLDKLDNENVLANNYYVYDNIRKYSYNIINYNSSSTYAVNGTSTSCIELTIDAFFNYEDAYPDSDTSKNKDIFKSSTNIEITNAVLSQANVAQLTPPVSGTFLSINRKDLNSYRIDYYNNKQSLALSNATIDMNERIINNQKIVYDAQLNKNTFLNRQVLIFNIIICIIVLILIVINVVNVDKEHIKSISLACLGIILLLLVIYYISNITYIETFQTSSSELNNLKRNYANAYAPTFASYKNKILNDLIVDVNTKFISYFEKILIVLPSVDTTSMYREIKDTTQADKDNKEHIKKLLEARRTQSLNNMNALKYELDNNKLYILTLLISSIIFIGLYNIYINYITEDKYVSLIIFISFIIFIVILSYYIINSNRQVRSTYKNIYWGPELSTDF
jgi:hypothetical protein